MSKAIRYHDARITNSLMAIESVGNDSGGKSSVLGTLKQEPFPGDSGYLVGGYA